MYIVHFGDSIHGDIQEEFDSFDAAVEYWNEYADTPSCYRGLLMDNETGEVIWSFTPEDEACE